LERLIPARPQPILRRGLVTEDLYVFINVVLRIGSPDRSLGPSRTQAVTCFPRGLVARPARLQAIAVIVVLDFFHWAREAPLTIGGDGCTRCTTARRPRLVFERPPPHARKDPRPNDLPRAAALLRSLRRGTASTRRARRGGGNDQPRSRIGPLICLFVGP